MATIQDGETHGEDVATGGYIERWTTAAGLNSKGATAVTASAGSPRPGWMQTGDVHADVTEVVANAPKWNMT